MKTKITFLKCVGMSFLLFSLGFTQVLNAKNYFAFKSARQLQDITVISQANTPMGKGTINQRILLVGVIGDSIEGTAPAAVTQLNFTVTGADQIAKLTVFNGSIWSVDPNYASVFGSVTNPGTTVSIDGSYTLTNANSGTYAGADDARFIVLIDLKPEATTGTTIDIVCDNMVVGGVTQTAIPGSTMTPYVTVSENLSGTKTIKATGGDYATIKAAITDVNNKGVGVDGLELVLDDDATYTVGQYDANSIYTGYIRAKTTEANPLIVRRSGTGTNRPIINCPNNTSTVLGFYGSDYVTVDGLSIVNLGTYCAKGIVFQGMPADGCNHNVVKNCYLDLNNSNSAAQTGAIRFESLATTADGKNTYNKVFGNTCKNADAGVMFNSGTALTANYDTDNEIYNNTINGNFGLNYGGICLYQTGSTKIYNNVLDGSGSSVNYFTAFGIKAYPCFGTIDCYGNTVKNITNASTSNQARVLGINILSTVVNIYNNMVSNLKAEASTSTNSYHSAGIALGTNATIAPHYYIWNNSVYLNQVTPTTGTSMNALYVGGNQAVNYTLINNIFVNTSTGGTNRVLFADWTDKSKLDAGSDNNLYYPEGTNFVYGYATLAAYKTAMASVSKDQNSVSALPPFISVSDLHIPDNSTTVVSNGGKAVTFVTPFVDIDGETRNSNTPDMGADEFASTATAIESLVDSESFKMYPNPAQSEVVISSEDEIQSVEFIGLDGRLAKRIDTGFNMSINISDLQAGLYVVRVNTIRGFKYNKLRVN